MPPTRVNPQVDVTSESLLAYGIAEPCPADGVATTLETPMPDRMADAFADDWLAAVCDESETARLVCDLDWAGTSLGHPSTWPLSLRAAVRMCMTTRFPVLVAWGPELVKIYNEGYRGMLGPEKHPRALGSPAKEVWPEIWHVIGPQFEQVLHTGVATWDENQCLLIEREGRLEEVFFSYSYSPIHDDDGAIGGVLDIAVETTAAVVTARRLDTLARLQAALVPADDATDACARASAALSRSIDLPSVDVYLMLDGIPSLVSSGRRDGIAPIDPDRVWEILRDDVVAIVPDGKGGERVLVDLSSTGAATQGVMAANLTSVRPFDDGYRTFVDLVASSIGAAVDAANARAVERDEYHHINETLQAAMLRPASDLATVAARYLPAVGGLAVGGDWYDVVSLDDERRAVVVGDCVGSGLDAATVMAQLRTAARTMLIEGHDPASTVAGVDGFAARLDGAACTTMLCAIFDRRGGTVTYCRAGHPPGLVVHADGVEWLDAPGGPPLALGDLVSAPRTNTTTGVGHGDIVVLYSDGLVERRGERLDDGFARLAAVAQRRRGETVQAIADGLIRELLPDGATDDVVLVVKSFERVP